MSLLPLAMLFGSEAMSDADIKKYVNQKTAPPVTKQTPKKQSNSGLYLVAGGIFVAVTTIIIISNNRKKAGRYAMMRPPPRVMYN